MGIEKHSFYAHQTLDCERFIHLNNKPSGWGIQLQRLLVIFCIDVFFVGIGNGVLWLSSPWWGWKSKHTIPKTDERAWHGNLIQIQAGHDCLCRSVIGISRRYILMVLDCLLHVRAAMEHTHTIVPIQGLQSRNIGIYMFRRYIPIPDRKMKRAQTQDPGGIPPLKIPLIYLQH